MELKETKEEAEAEVEVEAEVVRVIYDYQNKKFRRN